MGLGAIFLLILAGVFYLFNTTDNFKDENAVFVEQFLYKYSERWETSDVRDMLSKEFLSSLNTGDSRRAITNFKSLGKLRKISEIEMTSYNAMNSETTGTFVLKAKFENSITAVTVSVRKDERGLRILSLNINAIQQTPMNRAIPI